MIGIQSDVTSLKVQNNLHKATNALNRSVERLSTGFRINHASDNAAILSISKNIEAQLSGSRVALDNTQIGYNMLSVADDALGEMQNIANEIRDKCLQAANGTYSTAERADMQTEVNQRLEEIYREKNTTTFNQINVFGEPESSDGTGGSDDGEITLQIGADSGSNNQLTVNTEFKLGSYTIDVSTAENASASVKEVDKMLEKLSTQRSNCGAQQNVLSDVSNSLNSKITNLESSYSTYMDTDYAAETVRYTQASIMQDTNEALLIQMNSRADIALSLLTNLKVY